MIKAPLLTTASGRDANLLNLVTLGKFRALPQNLWVWTDEKDSAPARQEGSPSHLHHHLAPVD